MHYNKPIVISLIITCILLSSSCSKSDSSGGGGGTTSAAITSLTCTGGSFSATATANVLFSASGTVPYTGGNGAMYGVGSSISSTGVTGLTATLQAGTLTNSAGSLSYSITGTPTAAGDAIFSISFGGQSCSLSLHVNSATPSITALACGSGSFSAMATIGIVYSGTATVPYSGGNGVSYNSGAVINSTGVTGLTAILQSGTLTNANGNLIYTISGSPSTAGTATFPINFGGQNCSLSLIVNVDINPLAGVYDVIFNRFNYIGSTGWAGPSTSLGLATSLDPTTHIAQPSSNPPGLPTATFYGETGTAGYPATIFQPVTDHIITGYIGNVTYTGGSPAQYLITADANYQNITYNFPGTWYNDPAAGGQGYSNTITYVRGYIPPSPTKKPAFRLITIYNNALSGSGHDRIVDETFRHR